MSQILDFDVLWSILKNPKKGIKNQIIADCPKCGREKHFYINAGYNAKGRANPAHCKRCNWQTNIVGLLVFLNKLELLGGRQVDLKKPLPKLSSLNREVEEIDIDIKTIKLPIGFKKVKFNDNNRYTEYLKSRKFTELDFEIYQPGYTWKKKYNDYVIIPVTRDWDIKGFVGRYIGVNKDAPRYLNSEHDFSKLLFGYDELEPGQTTTAILVEGGFDKVSVTTELDLHNNEGIKCLCSFGKKLSDEQLLLLQKAGIENLFLMFDARDAIKEIKSTGFKIKRQFNNILCCDTGSKLDPGSSNKEMLLEILAKSKSVDRFQLDKLSTQKLK